eukprot:1778722-Rhodomonas_salina.2
MSPNTGQPHQDLSKSGWKAFDSFQAKQSNFVAHTTGFLSVSLTQKCQPSAALASMWDYVHSDCRASWPRLTTLPLRRPASERKNGKALHVAAAHYWTRSTVRLPSPTVLSGMCLCTVSDGALPIAQPCTHDGFTGEGWRGLLIPPTQLQQQLDLNMPQTHARAPCLGQGQLSFGYSLIIPTNLATERSV